jgi:hypothetical protein
MSTYNVYNPMQARDAAYQRLMDLSQARQRFTDEMFRRSEEERVQQQRYAEAQERENLGSVYGSTARGALAGMSGGPVGAAIGAGAGLILGTMGEVHNRKEYAKLHGKKLSNWGALKKTFGRAPNTNEFASIVGAGAGAANMAAAPELGGGSMEDAQLAQNNALASFYMNQKSATAPGGAAPGSTFQPTGSNYGANMGSGYVAAYDFGDSGGWYGGDAVVGGHGWDAIDAWGSPKDKTPEQPVAPGRYAGYGPQR